MKNVAILGVIAIAMVGFAYFTLFSTPAHDMKGEAEDSIEGLEAESVKTSVAKEPRQGTGTLESLRVSGEDLECTIVYKDDTQQSVVEGTYFVSGGTMRGDFLTESPDLSGQILSSMIIDEAQMLYIWSEIEGMSYGIKVDLTTVDPAETESHEPISLTADVQYDCKPWENVDRTVFKPRADVLFQDMNELKKAGMEYGTVYEEELASPGNSPCDLCDQVSAGEGQDECRARFQCN